MPTPEERSGKFYDDVFSYQNVVVRNEGVQHFVNSEAGLSGEFTYRFDFTTTDYRAASVSIADRIVLFDSAPSGAQILVQYAVNGGDWVTLSSLTRSGTTQDLNHYTSPWTIDFGETIVSTFDYRVSFVGTTASNFTDQWGRSNASQTPFAISFDVVPAVPEAAFSSIVIALAGGAFLLIKLGSRRNRQSKA